MGLGQQNALGDAVVGSSSSDRSLSLTRARGVVVTGVGRRRCEGDLDRFETQTCMFEESGSLSLVGATPLSNRLSRHRVDGL